MAHNFYIITFVNCVAPMATTPPATSNGNALRMYSSFNRVPFALLDADVTVLMELEAIRRDANLSAEVDANMLSVCGWKCVPIRSKVRKDSRWKFIRRKDRGSIGGSSLVRTFVAATWWGTTYNNICVTPHTMKSFPSVAKDV